MGTNEHSVADIVHEWDEFERALLALATETRGGTQLSPALEGLDDEREVLCRLALRSQVERARSKPRGNVIFLHGITGADLAVESRGDQRDVWLNLRRLIFGQINDLKLHPSGAQEANPELKVIPIRINKRYYARAMIALRARWNVVPFAYDWRKDIDTASDQLAALIHQHFADQPVHLVAHSMGGLVARNLIRREPRLWEAMQDPERVAGGRLIMLGTPNYGSFAIVQAITGEDQLLGLLEKCDITHDMKQLLGITNTFVGSYQLLPAPSKLPAALNELYRKDTWSERAQVSQAHLNRAFEFHRLLETGATIDPARMVYIAGSGHPTITSMSIAGRGDFEYTLTREGDGRVPHALGLLRGVPTFYIDEAHGDLARNERVLSALDGLLETGSTCALASSPVRGVERGTPSMLDYRGASDRALMSELDRIAAIAQTSGGPQTLSTQDVTLGEDALIRAALGSGRSSHAAAPVVDRERTARVMNLRVQLQLGDICDVKAPMIVAGHYRGLKPVQALGEIDQRLNHWISIAIKQGMIGGDLGETFLVPTLGKLGKHAAQTVVIAGMGEFGTFDENGLRILMTNVTTGAGALGLKTFATVLVGAGEGNLDLDKVLCALLSGIGVGLSNLVDETGTAPTLEEVIIVERNSDRFMALREKLDQTCKNGSLPNMQLSFQEPRPSEIARARRQLTGRGAGYSRVAAEFSEIRITVECPDQAKNRYRFSAIAPDAVIPVRDVDASADVVRRTAEALRASESPLEQRKYGRLLYDYLLPEDFHNLLTRELPVRLIVDRATASIPWEMACFPARSNAESLTWLGLQRRLSRQFRSMLSRPPGTTPPLNEHLRVLVIADPAVEQELRLPAARMEGRRVVEALRHIDGRELAGGRKLHIDVESRIGANECDMVEILAQVLTGRFDVIHFAGHGDHNPDDPTKSGWIFGRDQILCARDIFRARCVPRLVFANACFSGVIREGVAQAPDELSRGLATIAQAFFERGVPNFIGSGWPVSDAQAATFAETFYERALNGTPRMLDALSEARQAIFDQRVGATWGAYQYYGNPSDSLVRAENLNPGECLPMKGSCRDALDAKILAF